MHGCNTGDIVTHFTVDGPENGPTIVFSNSLGTDFRSWDDVVARLSGKFRCIRYDKRGHGLTDLTPAPYSIDQLTGDLNELLDHLGVTDAVICGLSVGGVIAQNLASQHPARVRAIILCDTAAKIGTQELWDARIKAVNDGGIKAISEAILQRWFSATFPEKHPEAFANWRNMLIRTPAQGYVGVCHALAAANLTQATAKLTIPALVLGGSEDGATPPDVVRATADLITGAAFQLIDGVGHLPCIEAPDVLATLIEDFAGAQYNV